jgi:hypothetical protein
MPFTGKSTYAAGATLPELSEDVADLVSISAIHDTPLLDALGDATRVAYSTVHEWLEDAPAPLVVPIVSVTSPTQWVVSAAANLRPGDFVQVGSTNELALITARSESGANATLTAERGYSGTTVTPSGGYTDLTMMSRAAIEGADAAPARFTNRVRQSNYTQIFTATVEVSGTQRAVNTPGVRDELEYQKTLRLRELLRDLERTIVRGLPPAANQVGTSTAPRSMRGIVASLGTNVVPAAELVQDAESLTEPVLNAMLRRIWESGNGTPDLIVVGGREKRRINEFVASNRRFFTSNESYKDLVSTYESDFGVCRVVLSRNVPAGSALVLDSSRIQVVPLSGRSFHYVPLATTGDRVSGQLIGEYTVEVRNEAAHGIITGLIS